MELQLKDIIAKAISSSIQAGKVILDVYESEFDVELKDDRSPLTKADKQSHLVISEALSQTDLPMLSEEGKEIAYETRKLWKRYWLVDPLDGTKEFIKRNGEFTVNIALIDDQRPVFGIIYVPVHKELYFGGKDYGSYKISDIDVELGGYDAYRDRAEKLPFSVKRDQYKMIGSRSHMSAETQAYFDEVKKTKGEISIMSRGSSLKLCMIAEGQADEYPRFAPTMEWDTAAGQAIIEGAGKKLIHYKSGEDMRYNRENLVNGWFVAKNQ